MVIPLLAKRVRLEFTSGISIEYADISQLYFIGINLHISSIELAKYETRIFPIKGIKNLSMEF